MWPLAACLQSSTGTYGSLWALQLSNPYRVCVLSVSLLVLCKKCLTRLWSSGLTRTVWPAPSCLGSRAVCLAQPQTPGPGTVTCKRDMDCAFRLICLSLPSLPALCRLPRFGFGFALSHFWSTWVAADTCEGNCGHMRLLLREVQRLPGH